MVAMTLRDGAEINEERSWSPDSSKFGCERLRVGKCAESADTGNTAASLRAVGESPALLRVYIPAVTKKGKTYCHTVTSSLVVSDSEPLRGGEGHRVRGVLYTLPWSRSGRCQTTVDVVVHFEEGALTRGLSTGSDPAEGVALCVTITPQEYKRVLLSSVDDTGLSGCVIRRA